MRALFWQTADILTALGMYLILPEIMPLKIDSSRNKKDELIRCTAAIDPVTWHTDTLYHLYCYLLDFFKIWKVG